MNKFRFTIQMLAVATFLFAAASMAQAQATRTWVSGVGDDVNPCSRTAPCKTFAGAISKTADKGEIDCLDPGGFGTVTITKNITIDGTHGAGFGSILASGTNGVNVNDSATATPNTIIVRLHSLSINGGGTGFTGIRFVSGKSVFVEDCQIFNFKGNGTSSHGIDLAPTTNANQELSVKDTIIENNTGSGIHVNNPAFGASVVIDNCRMDKNQNGVFVQNNANFNMNNSSASFNVGAGVFLGGTASANLTDNTMQFNGTGLDVTTTVGTTRIGNNTITQNTTNGVHCTTATNPNSYLDNRIKGNGTDLNGCNNPMTQVGKN